jgi:hypothetical protein
MQYLAVSIMAVVLHRARHVDNPPRLRAQSLDRTIEVVA